MPPILGDSPRRAHGGAGSGPVVSRGETQSRHRHGGAVGAGQTGRGGKGGGGKGGGGAEVERGRAALAITGPRATASRAFAISSLRCAAPGATLSAMRRRATLLRPPGQGGRAGRPPPWPGAAGVGIGLALALGTLGALAPPAAAERAMVRNGMVVQGDAPGFEVFPGRAAGGTDLFCAAGDFARRHLNARATDRVEIVHPPASTSGATRPGRRSVGFALRPPGSGANEGLDRWLLRPGAVGTSRSVAFAESLCGVVERRRDADD